jgi:SAM-dependent methyltransferase
MPFAQTTERARKARLTRVTTALVCPTCHGTLACSESAVRCGPCAAEYPVRHGRIYFVDVPAREDDFDRVKGWLKKVLGQAYYTVGIQFFAPTFPLNFTRVVTRHIDPSSMVVVDAGSGNNRLHPDIIGIDVFDYDAVDIVCRLEALPFRAGVIDAIVSRSVLEHTPDPAEVVREFHRCTKTGGIGIHMIPFLFPAHASPVDYHRFTPDGHDILFSAWHRVSRTNPTGPVTVLLLYVIEVLSTILGLGVPRLRSLAYLFLCGLTFPLKFLDFIFVNRPAFLPSAASVLSVVRKTDA